nr:MAG TPA: hypothetical protein [Bacteriophage sp.]
MRQSVNVIITGFRNYKCKRFARSNHTTKGRN